MVDPRTPVIVGVAQRLQHTDDLGSARPPLDLLADAARGAATDAGTGERLLTALDTVGVVEIVSWRTPDPGASLAARLGAEAPTTITTATGGSAPQELLETVAGRIVRGATDVALVGGAEALRTRIRARRPPKTWLPWEREEGPACARVVGDPTPGSSDLEERLGLDAPVRVYPLFETARRHARELGVDEHRRQVGGLWSTFAQVAAENPHAWSRVPFRPDEIVRPGPDNRMVVVPYTKRMCANEQVDMASALVVTSYEAARAHGVDEDRMVFPWSSAHARDPRFVTERASLASAPAIAVVVGAALEAGGIDVDDVARFDLYSCFPAAVEQAMDALALPGPNGGDDRPLTVTGGLCFAGGPASNYVSHSIAAMVDACRSDPGSVGLVTGVGWYLTKHAAGLFSTRPPARGFRPADADGLRARLDASPRRTPRAEASAEAVIEATAVEVDRDGAGVAAFVTALEPDGSRAVLAPRDAETCGALLEEPWEGRPLRDLLPHAPLSPLPTPHDV